MTLAKTPIGGFVAATLVHTPNGTLPIEVPCFRTTVPNLHVEDFHSSFVGKAGVCVRGS